MATNSKLSELNTATGLGPADMLYVVQDGESKKVSQTDLMSATYTQSEVNSLLSGKANSSHGHTESDLTDLDKYSQSEVDSLLADKLDTGGTSAASVKLSTPRTISLTGDATGSGSFDGTEDITINVTTATTQGTDNSFINSLVFGG
jgi:hypothetical protein